MKENINEHDMTKKMMEIIRGQHKSLIKEVEEPQNNLAQQPTQSQLVPGDDLPEPEQKMAKPPVEGREPMIKLDDTYVEMDKNDQRFKDISKKLEDIANVEVTSVYISKNNDLVITGDALQYEDSGLYFTMALSKKDVLTSSENVEGNESNDIIKKLQGFLENLRDDIAGTREYLYDEKIDGNKEN
jgi:hypothetical protein